MKKNLRAILLSIFLATISTMSYGQTTVTIDGSATWVGYMNVFDSTGTTYLWGSGWGVPDLKSTIDVSNNTVTLQPNFNTYANAATAADTAYWHNGAQGNKVMEALTFVEDTTLIGQTVTFKGDVQSHTLNAAYTHSVFIKALDPNLGYTAVVNQTSPIPATGQFNLSAVIPNTNGLIIQYGFSVRGMNANPTQETALGSIVLEDTVVATPPPSTNATVSVSGSANWIGYMNVFDSTGNTYLWGSGWGVPDLKSTVDSTANTVTLQPNFNAYANAATAADTAYWHNGAQGNKVMEALTFVEDSTLIGKNVTFTGNVNSHNLDNAYASTIFIKALDPSLGYSAVVNQSIPTPTSGVFTINATIPNTAGLIVQYGFSVHGMNANPAQETALGSIILGDTNVAPPLGTTITVDASEPWLGYMNVFDSTGTTYLWGSGWGVPDLKTTLDTVSNTVILQPNFNTYANAATAADTAYWHNGLQGNKVLEAISYVEDTTLIGQNVTFEGIVTNNDLDTAYTRTVFVKALDPNLGYAAVVNQFITIPASGLFSVTATIPNTPGLIVQYGFTVRGLNANPMFESLGNVTVGPQTPLAVGLLSFDAKAQASNVSLSWETENVEQLDEFIVQRSLNGLEFQKLGSVIARQGENQSYNFVDEAPQDINYYRLKMMDQNGSVVYSETKRVSFQGQSTLVVYPNPASDYIAIRNTYNKPVQVQIINLSGKVLRTVTLAEFENRINVSALPAGSYILLYKDAQSIQFIKK